MKIILGIGNIGDEYVGTRHNCGFEVVEHLAREAGLAFARNRRWRAAVCLWSVAADRVLLLKPETWVNGSGTAAQAAMAFYQVAPADLLVVVDDLNLALGDLRYRPRGSAGGHNGLKDIEARIGRDYPRLRLGIGAPCHAGATVDHVLSRFSADERPDVELMLARAAACARDWLDEGDAVMGRYNGPLRPPPPRNAGPRPAATGGGGGGA